MMTLFPNWSSIKIRSTQLGGAAQKGDQLQYISINLILNNQNQSNFNILYLLEVTWIPKWWFPNWTYY
jgi:hypothetical protein